MYYDWSVFTLNDIGEEQKCYVVSFPKKSIGNYKNKRDPYVLITKFKDKPDEFTLDLSQLVVKLGNGLSIIMLYIINLARPYRNIWNVTCLISGTSDQVMLKTIRSEAYITYRNVHRLLVCY